MDIMFLVFSLMIEVVGALLFNLPNLYIDLPSSMHKFKQYQER